MTPSLRRTRREPRWARAFDHGRHAWLLSAAERGNDRSGLPEWSEGNAVHAFVDGRSYLSELATVLDGIGDGDAVLVAGWRAEAEELLDDGGPPLSAALVRAACRGVLVRVLLWRSHPASWGTPSAPIGTWLGW